MTGTELHVQQMAQIGALGILGHSHATNFATVLDYDHLQHVRTVSLQQATGIREVSSKNVPAGPSSP
jgi:hypothetical protein